MFQTIYSILNEPIMTGDRLEDWSFVDAAALGAFGAFGEFVVLPLPSEKIKLNLIV